MRVILDPATPNDVWSLATHAAPPDSDDLAALRGLVNAAAARLDLPAWHHTPTRVIATGHQAWLWHPGILAKDLATHHLATHHLATRQSSSQNSTETAAVHLVVDHDTHDALQLPVPVCEGDTLRRLILSLGPEQPDIPTGMRPPLDAAAVQQQLDAAMREHALTCDLSSLRDAWDGLPPCRSLAEQLTVVQHRLRVSLGAPLPVVFTSQLHTLDVFRRFVADMLHDARACVGAYNQAAAAHPEAGITPLGVEPDRVELPLWLLRPEQPRTRVYADLADSTPLLTDAAGNPLPCPPRDNTAPEPPDTPEAPILAPRALLLTAVVRTHIADLFIHGRGGGTYDRVMEAWLHTWHRPAPRPMAVVSADVFLDFNVPLASAHDLARAIWWLHHLPHNIDRHADAATLDPDLVSRKHAALAVLRDSEDPHTKAAAFAKLHKLNAQLATTHANLIDSAKANLAATKRALQNHQITTHRDWPAWCHPPEVLKALHDAVRAKLT